MIDKVKNSHNDLIYTVDLGTWDKFVEFAATADTEGIKNPTARRTDREYIDFCGSNSFEEALELARYGWPDGLKRVAEISANIDRLIAQEIEGDEIIYSPAGYAPVVGAYLAGRPDSMLRLAEVEGARPVIKIAVNISASCDIDGKRIIAMGAAVASLIKAFEIAGYSTEVDLLQVVNGHNHNGKRTYCNISCNLKRAGHALELDRLIFAIAHPSTLRRLIFNIEEARELKSLRDIFGFRHNGGHGMPCTNSYFLKDKYQVLIEGKFYGAVNWNIAESCREWILEQLQSAGVKLHGELFAERS